MKLEKTDRKRFAGHDGEEYVEPGEYEFSEDVAESHLEWPSWERAESGEDDEDVAVVESTKKIHEEDTDLAEPEEAELSSDEDPIGDALEELEVSTIPDEGDTGEGEPESVDLTEFLSQTVNPICEDIRDGEYDDDLEKLRTIEKSTTDRKTVKDEIDRQMEKLDG